MRADGVFSGGGVKGIAFAGALQATAEAEGRPLVPEEFPIAEAVRISAGFPYFFPPLSLRDARTGKEGVLVDGGVASPFPVYGAVPANIVHDPPQEPTDS